MPHTFRITFAYPVPSDPHTFRISARDNDNCSFLPLKLEINLPPAEALQLIRYRFRDGAPLDFDAPDLSRAPSEATGLFVELIPPRSTTFDPTEGGDHRWFIPRT